MAAQDPISKRQSAASSGSTPPNAALVFFIDRSLGKKVIAEKLRQSGVTVEIHFGSGQMKAQEMAEAFVKALPKISHFARTKTAPFFARISRSGNVSILS